VLHPQAKLLDVLPLLGLLPVIQEDVGFGRIGGSPDADPVGTLLGILNANRKIRKRTDTDVAFTREYSRVSIFHRERECTN